MKKLFFILVFSLLFLIPFLGEAEMSSMPFFRNYRCFWEEKNQDITICKKFYITYCFDDPYSAGFPLSPLPIPAPFVITEGQSVVTFGEVIKCPKVLACPKFTNPVYDHKGMFYPSACWAEHLGVKDFQYGISEKVSKFISNLWREQGYIVPKPSMEFSYGGNWPNFKDGVLARSTVWQDSKILLTLDFNIQTNQNKTFTPSFTKHTLVKPPFGKRKVLLAYVIFEEAYPENVLLGETPKYVHALNDYFRKKQQVKNPVSLDVTPIVIPPPKNLGRPDSNGQLTHEDHLKIYRAARNKIGRDDFDILVYIPVGDRFQGGQYHSNLEGKEFIISPLYNTRASYSTDDTESGIRAIWQLQDAFHTLSHELLHAMGLDADHFPMGEGVYYSEFVGAPHIDHVTGKPTSGGPVPLEYDEKDECDFFGTSPDYYTVKLPRALRIRVGNEPEWAMKVESETGPCIFPSSRNTGNMLKDKDRDGVYEIVYNSQPIGDDLQRMLGWIDVDGDGIAELDDPNPYGGFGIAK